MKLIGSLFVVISIVALPGCSSEPESGEPLSFVHYCEIIDRETGQNFFDVHSDSYSLDSIKRFTDHNPANEGSDGLRVAGRVLIIYGGVALKRVYIDYGNGDIDTVEQVGEPLDDDGDIKRSLLQRSHFYLNGEKQFTFDYQSDDSLWHKLDRLNNINEKKFNPLAIKLFKSPEK